MEAWCTEAQEWCSFDFEFRIGNNQDIKEASKMFGQSKGKGNGDKNGNFQKGGEWNQKGTNMQKGGEGGRMYSVSRSVRVPGGW